MSSQTPNLHLVKPADGEAADISVINGNMDTIDTEVNSLRESVSLPSGRKLRIDVGGSYMAVKILDASDAEKYRFVLGPTSIAYHVDNVLQWTK